MNSTNEEAIALAVEQSNRFPNPTIEYNFEEEVDLKLFKGVKAIENKMAKKDSANVIYRMG